MRYEYKCDDCEHIWDEYHSIEINDAVEELNLSCPECSSINIKKYLGNYGTATVVFKGPGFAINDLAMEKIGMPKAQRESVEARDAMKKRIQ